MPSKETSPVNERVKFIAVFLEGSENFSELCERFGISQWKVHLGPVPLGMIDVRRAKPLRHSALFSPLVRLDEPVTDSTGEA
jgi:hypothetical protein